MYSAAIKSSLIVAEQAALEQHGPSHASELGEQREVLHVARADLQHVGVLGDEIDLPRVHHLGDDRQAGLGAHLGEDLERVGAQALERVRRRARLERAAAKHRRAGVAHGGGRCASISRFSTEHGPAITVISLPPNAACASRPPTRTIVRSTANSRDASLYGLSTGVTDSTPGSDRSGSSCSSDSSPMQPMIVRCSPRERWVRIPTDSMRSRMWSISASVTLGG